MTTTPTRTRARTWRYVGPHDAVDLIDVGVVARDATIVTALDLAGRDDFELVDDQVDQDTGPGAGGGPGVGLSAAKLQRLPRPELAELASDAGIDPAGQTKAQLAAQLVELASTAATDNETSTGTSDEEGDA